MASAEETTKLTSNQEQPKHLLMENTLGGTGSDFGSDFCRESCLKNAFTAPTTPSSFFIALASSRARSFTCMTFMQIMMVIIFCRNAPNKGCQNSTIIRMLCNYNIKKGTNYTYFSCHLVELHLHSSIFKNIHSCVIFFHRKDGCSSKTFE